MTATAERVARNASYTLAGNLVASIAGAVSSVVLARLLGPPAFGTYALVLSSAGILGLLASLGVPHGATKYVAEYQGRGESGTAGQVLAALVRLEAAMAIAVGAAAFLLAPLLQRVFEAPGFATAFRIAAAGLVPATLAGLLLAALQGLQDYRRVTLISLASTLFLLSATVGLLAAGAGVAGAVGALAAAATLSGLLGWRALRHHLRLPLRGCRLPGSARAKLRRYVPTVSLVLLLDTVVWQRSEVFFLGVFRTPQEVAWYALAFGAAATLMRLLPRALSFVLPPVASSLYGAGDREGLQTLFDVGSRYVLMLAAPLVVGGALLARPLLTSLYGERYGPAAAVFPLLLAAAGAGAVGSVTAGIQNGIERQDLVLKVALVATVVNIVLDITLIPRFGLSGAAVANAAAQVGAVAAGIVLTGRVLGIRFPTRDCLRVLAAAGASGLPAYGVAATIGGVRGLAAAVAAAAVAYPVALLAAGALRTSDVERLQAARDALPGRLRPGYGGLLRLAARWTA